MSSTASETDGEGAAGGPGGVAIVADLEARLADTQARLGPAAADPRTSVDGIAAVRQQPRGVLTSLGFPRRDDTGATFDPARHEAVATTYDPRVPPGTVVQVVRAGYGEPDRQLRPAQVVVAKAD